jgi:hypothetical protein
MTGRSAGVRQLSRKTIATIAGIAVVAAGGGIAYAYWTAAGSGSSSDNTTGTTQNLVIHQTTTVSAMGPGVVAQDLAGNFDNPNPGPAYVGKVVASVTGTTNPLCTAADFTLVQPAAVNAEVPSGTAQGAWHLGSIAFKNDPTRNQDVCKSVTVTVGYVLDNS